MMQPVPISEFRKKIFEYAKLVDEEGAEIVVEKNGKKIFRVIKIDKNAKESAKKALNLLKDLSGSWTKNSDKEFFRGKKEKKYIKELGNW